MINTAIILAGGQSTRLKSLTKDLPKPMMDINGKPILEYLILQLKKSGIKRIIISVGYLAQTIIDYFADGKKWGVDITYSIETEALGTGGAVKRIADNLSNPFILLWGDNLTDINFKKMISRYNLRRTNLLMVLVEREDTENFGVVVVQDQDIIGFVEKPKREDAPSTLVNAGCFIITPDLLKNMPVKFSIEKELFEKIVTQQKVSYYIHNGMWLPTDTPEKLEMARLKWKFI